MRRRTQIYLNESQHRWLDAESRRLRRPRSDLIREAIDRFIRGGQERDDARLQRFRAAVDASFGTIPDLPSGREFVDEVRADDAREQALEERSRSSSTRPS